MRIALISDLHANLIALDAVLADIKSVGADQVVCLGDIAALGPQPCEVVGRIRDLKCPTIEGNHDPFSGVSMVLRELEDWTRARLSEGDLAFLRALPATLEVALGPEATLLCVHGSPRSFEEQILATTTDDDLDAFFEGHEFTVVACGHTHIQLLRRHRQRTVVNVGSVGMPFERAFDGSGPPSVLPYVEYAFINWVKGALTVDLRQLPIDFEAYKASVRASGMPYQDWWCKQWICE